MGGLPSKAQAVSVFPVDKAVGGMNSQLISLSSVLIPSSNKPDPSCRFLF